MKRALILATLVVLALGSGEASAAPAKAKKRRKTPEPTAVPRPPDPYRVTFTTADGVAIAATWRPVASTPRAPVVLLLHDFSRDRRTWDALAPELNALGIATLAIDLRAHGESLKKAGTAAPIHLSPQLQSDPGAFPRDVEAACAWLRSRASKVSAMGVSLGGNLVVLATAARWVESGVAISANVDRLAVLSGGRPTAPAGLLVLATEDDPLRAASARALDASGGAPKRLLIFPGAAHNLALMAEHPEAKRSALEWLVERLGVVPPVPTPTPTALPAPTPGPSSPSTKAVVG